MKKLKIAKTNREYNILLKSYKVTCSVCDKRAGGFNVPCGIFRKHTEKNWKKSRKTQYHI